ncbi:OmpA family protein [Vibrio sp. RC27]
MKNKIITLIAVCSAISLSAQADTTVLQHYCGKSGVKFVESVEVDSANRVYVGFGGMTQDVGRNPVVESDAVIKSVNKDITVAQGCKDFLVRRYKEEPSGRVTFEFDKDELTPAAKFVLEGVGDELLTYNIVGNTDSIGTDNYNLELGGARAHEVAQYLEKNGLPYGSVRVISLGEMDPIALNTTAEGRALNRRVDITLSK